MGKNVPLLPQKSPTPRRGAHAPHPPRDPFRWLLLTAAVSLLLFAGSLHFVRIDRHDPTAGHDNLISLLPYWTTFAITWSLLTTLARHLTQSPGPPTISCAPTRRAAAFILTTALAARLIALAAPGAQLSDDLWRYLHDGRQTAVGINPYAKSPNELTADQHHDPLLDQINHPQLVTIYQPTSQLIFALFWHLHPTPDQLAQLTFRAGFAAIDLALVALLIGALSRQHRSPWWAVLYAWHPLAVSEIAHSGHQDVIGMTLLLASVLLVHDRALSGVRAALSGMTLAAAAAVKPLFLPALLVPVWRRWRDPSHRPALVIATVVFTLACALLYAPFVLLPPGIGRMIKTTQAFAESWAFNSSIYGLIVWFTDSRMPAVTTAVGLLIGTIAACMRRGYDVTHVLVIYLFAALLVSSTAHPWYLLWGLAFVPMRFHAPTWVWSLTICWSYAVLGSVGLWRLPTWIVVVEYIPVYLALMWEVCRAGQRVEVV